MGAITAKVGMCISLSLSHTFSVSLSLSLCLCLSFSISPIPPSFPFLFVPINALVCRWRHVCINCCRRPSRSLTSKPTSACVAWAPLSLSFPLLFFLSVSFFIEYTLCASPSFTHIYFILASFPSQTREATFREISESTNQRVLWWSIAQALVLVVTAWWQVHHLKSFFQAKKLV